MQYNQSTGSLLKIIIMITDKAFTNVHIYILYTEHPNTYIHANIHAYFKFYLRTYLHNAYKVAPQPAGWVNLVKFTNKKKREKERERESKKQTNKER